MIERKLTPKQQAFVDFYIETGNATEAYIKAGYNKKGARANAARLIANDSVKSCIDERMEQLQSKRVANQQEILELLTSIARGEATAATLRGVGMGEQEIEEDMPPTMAERIKAAELLGKRYRMWTDKVDIEHSGEVKTSLDLSNLTTEELRAIANSNKRTN
ncbi:terminase small subunit [Ureibacillus sp. Re31]|uniref:Terminase small subunit n=1 Tax=Ureibacillus galli TaxID=2762222 RepID=A0ABR8XB43_9BACL|nr:terminase small subunit [Ureibacillus galli]